MAAPVLSLTMPETDARSTWAKSCAVDNRANSAAVFRLILICVPLLVLKSFTELVRQMAEVEIRLFETGRIEPRYSHSRCSRPQRFSHRTGSDHLQRSGLAQTRSEERRVGKAGR